MEGKEHHFRVEDAEKYGVIKAVLLYNLYFWLDKNKANDKHNYDGFYWTYNSAKALTKMFPYLSEDQIQVHLKQLEEMGVLKSGNYNEYKYDRTKWYTIPGKYGTLSVKSGNGIPDFTEPIPDNKPYKNTDTPCVTSEPEKEIKTINEKTGTKPSTVNRGTKDVENEIFEMYKKKIQPKARTLPGARIGNRLKTFSKEDILKAIDNFSNNQWWMTHNAFRGPTWFFNSDDRMQQFLDMPTDRVQSQSMAGNGVRQNCNMEFTGFKPKLRFS